MLMCLSAVGGPGRPTQFLRAHKIQEWVLGRKRSAVLTCRRIFDPTSELIIRDQDRVNCFGSVDVGPALSCFCRHFVIMQADSATVLHSSHSPQSLHKECQSDLSRLGVADGWVLLSRTKRQGVLVMSFVVHSHRSVDGLTESNAPSKAAPKPKTPVPPVERSWIGRCPGASCGTTSSRPPCHPVHIESHALTQVRDLRTTRHRPVVLIGFAASTEPL